MSIAMFLAAVNGDPPHFAWAAPFVLLLAAIAVLPLMRSTHHWWERNVNKLLVAGLLGVVTLAYYALREGQVRWGPSLGVLEHALVQEYFPFITLLFSLFVVAGGIVVRGAPFGTPTVNTFLMAVGGVAASVVGTTGASILLIRPLLRANQQRRNVVHTVVFFIFIVSNIGGSLLPIGDPPLFLGYLRGVPFFWTLALLPAWAFMLGSLLVIYWVWDAWLFRKQTRLEPLVARAAPEPLQIVGKINLLWLTGIVISVATLSADAPIPGTDVRAVLRVGGFEFRYVRELVLLAFAALSLLTTPRGLRAENDFSYSPILEVAALFVGIFLTMQPPLEILRAAGPQLAELGFREPWQYFWATGSLSAGLDNAPTYVVFLEAASKVPAQPGIPLISITGGAVREDLLLAVSCGAVFMGAMTYIGNGPNFMVKAVAEQAGVRMPSFFGYVAFSVCFLLPLLAVMNWLFFM